MLKKYTTVIYKPLMTAINWIVYNVLPSNKPLYNKKYNLAICAIFKDEARFLSEWIEYHEMIGVEHFYLYNNNSTDNYKEILSKYISSGLVTLIDWPYEQGQLTAYKHFHENYWIETQWVSFLDIDEFFVPKKESNLLDWIKTKDKYPVLLVYWKMFGSNGQTEHDSEKLCIEQYINSWNGLVKCGKCLINTDYHIHVFDASVHHRTVVEKTNIGFLPLYPINIFNQIVVNEPEIILNKSESEAAEIQINHYWSKGWDVYNHKRRWQGDVFFKTNPKNNISYFLKHELNNTSIDLNIRKYILMLKWKMAQSTEYKEVLEQKESLLMSKNLGSNEMNLPKNVSYLLKIW